MLCPECKSKNLIKFGKKWMPKLIIKEDKPQKVRVLGQQYQCKNCGRITIKPQEDNRE